MNFESFIKSYCHPPNRGDMNRARQRFERIQKNGDLALLELALACYQVYLGANRWYQPQMLSTWLGSANSEPWRYWLKDAPQTMEDSIDDDIAKIRAESIQRELARNGKQVTIEQILEKIYSREIQL